MQHYVLIASAMRSYTSRYNESIACGIVPLVWKDYDKTNKLVYSDWQRCYHLGDVVDKLEELRDGEFRGDMFVRYFKYDYVTKDKKYYTEKFNKKVFDFIKKLSYTLHRIKLGIINIMRDSYNYNMGAIS